MRSFALLLLIPATYAADPRLDAIRATLLPMRHPAAGLPARGATPAFTKVKHDLRDWIESRLPLLEWNGARWIPEPTVLQEQLNDELDRAGLFCEPKRSCEEESQLGYVDRITLEIRSGVLILKTGLGIEVCGSDESAYAYQSGGFGGDWRRFWQSEQNDYRDKQYFPQWLHAIKISPADYRPGVDRTAHLVLTLGSEPWCTSTWHPVYYRVWRTGSVFVEPKLLLDEREMAFPVEGVYGRAAKEEVFFEYSVAAGGGFRRPETQHYVLKDDKLLRTDPVALTPRQFAAFWLDHAWPVASRWTAPANRLKLRQWCEQNKEQFVQFAEPTLHCKQRPDLWQISGHTGQNPDRDVFFLIRWRPPDRFTMISISDKPSPDCTERDPEADKPRSLFQPQ